MEHTASRLLSMLERGALRNLQLPAGGSAQFLAGAYRPFHSTATALNPLATSSSANSTSSAASGRPTQSPPSQAPAALSTRSVANHSRPSPQQTPSASAAVALSPFERFKKDWSRVPQTPKLLGLSGAIPFLALNPPTAQHLAGILPTDLILNAASWQVTYAACIVSFLGAVNWGAAMESSLPGEVGKHINNERYMWSVLPSLLAWPLAMMEPAPASLAFCVFLPALYLRDKQFARLGYIPSWYLALRRVLTYAATFGMGITASYYVQRELDRLKKLEAQLEAQAGAAAQVQQ